MKRDSIRDKLKMLPMVVEVAEVVIGYKEVVTIRKVETIKVEVGLLTIIKETHLNLTRDLHILNSMMLNLIKNSSNQRLKLHQ